MLALGYFVAVVFIIFLLASALLFSISSSFVSVFCFFAFVICLRHFRRCFSFVVVVNVSVMFKSLAVPLLSAFRRFCCARLVK